jgi:serine/threonine protein kinase
MNTFVAIFVSVAAVALAITLVVMLAVPLFKGVAWLIRHVFAFVAGEITDLLRIVGAVVTSLFYALLVVGNVLIGRWSASAHYGRGMGQEFKNAMSALYRVVIGHPARLLGLSSLTEGVEGRLPAMMAAAPGSDLPSKRTGQFDGYRIIGSLPSGGSGAKLYIAEPDEIKRAAFERSGVRDVGQVVIKSFSVDDGSELPQILREGRALEAGKRLGLILDDELSGRRFYYVMRYVPGQALTLAVKQLHAECGGSGLRGRQLHLALGYVSDLLRTLGQYHAGGLWHKDVKPDNIIVDGPRAHLVDFGLITPLRSAMTLTTHGTEYFRDPELVRMALKGVKVQEVDGTRFDVYGAGAVLYAVLEDSFPAHGVLSPISKGCPEALRWIVRRAMADYDKRYTSVGAMLEDVHVVMASEDPFAVMPAALPSMRGAAMVEERVEDRRGEEWPPAIPPAIPAAISGMSGSMPPPLPNRGAGGRMEPAGSPRIMVTNWWTGSARTGPGVGSGGVARVEERVRAGVARAGVHAVAAAGAVGAAVGNWTRAGAGPRAAAEDQLKRARGRVQAARARAKARTSARRPAGQRYTNNPNHATIAALLLVGGAVAGVGIWANNSLKSGRLRIPGLTGAPEAMAVVDAPARNLPRVKGGSLIMVSDMLPPLSDQASERIGRVVRDLRGQGFTVVGNVVGERDESLDEEGETELLAAVRAARGAEAVDSKECRASLTEWLDGHDDVADVIVWVGRMEAEPERPLFHFFGRKSKGMLSDAAAAAQRIVRSSSAK